MAFFLYRQDITEMLANFKETHSWNSYSMGEKIREEIKLDARRKTAVFILFALVAAVVNVIAAGCYFEYMEKEYLVLLLLRQYLQPPLAFLFILITTVFNTLSIFSLYYFFYYLLHFKYQFRLFDVYVKRIAAEISKCESNDNGDDGQLKVKRALFDVVEHHNILKKLRICLFFFSKLVILVFLLQNLQFLGFGRKIPTF